MDDNELDEMIKKFVRECEEKNLNGIAAVAKQDNQNFFKLLERRIFAAQCA